MPSGAFLLNGGGMADYGGGLTVPVVVTCLMAASGGLIFGYDIGISVLKRAANRKSSKSALLLSSPTSSRPYMAWPQSPGSEGPGASTEGSHPGRDALLHHSARCGADGDGASTIRSGHGLVALSSLPAIPRP